MTEKKEVPHYHCTQRELYAVCHSGWKSCETHLDVFTTNKPFYTSLYVTDVLAEIDAAQALPDRQAREGIGELLRLQLAQAGDLCLRRCRLLKRYIKRAYPVNTIEATLGNAGMGYYDDAAKYDWDSTQSLMVAANSFIVTNSVDLSANSNMPVSFPIDFLNAKENFNAINDLFIAAEKEADLNSQIKVKANNAIHAKTMDMLEDGAVFCEDDPALKAQFVFDYILGLVSSPGPAGLKGMMLNGNTSGPLANVTLSLYEGTDTAFDAAYTTTSVEDGGYDFGGIASGSYTLKMECTGFVTKLEVVVIAVGVTSSKSFTLLLV